MGDDTIFESNMPKPAVNGGAAKVGEQRIFDDHVGRRTFGHRITANADAAIFHPRVVHVKFGPALDKNAAQ